MKSTPVNLHDLCGVLPGYGWTEGVTIKIFTVFNLHGYVQAGPETTSKLIYEDTISIYTYDNLHDFTIRGSVEIFCLSHMGKE